MRALLLSLITFGAGCTTHARGYVGAARHGDGTIFHAGIAGGIGPGNTADLEGASLEYVPVIGGVLAGRTDGDANPAFGLALGVDAIRVPRRGGAIGGRVGGLTEFRLNSESAFHHVHLGPSIVISYSVVQSDSGDSSRRRILSIGVEGQFGAIRYRDGTGRVDYNLGAGGAVTLEYTTVENVTGIAD